ncbi:MAG: DinB family protein [Trueperaceae bacterium]
MDLDEARSRLAVGVEAIECFVAGIGDEEAEYREGAGAWSVRDVLAQLLYEESADFRGRFRATLQDPAGPWPPIDSFATAEAARQGARSARALMDRFCAERAVSLAWLATLDEPDLDRSRYADGRRLRAGDLLAAWVAHDLVRLRQLTGARLAWWARQAAPFDVGYA